ncbi:Trihydrophobin like protein [Verticillium longisporum]|uniref:Trihydrophobin like protein n=1 Tax=Verticillium longisporum TaxID=100787 RepID=A0A8I2Z9C8_VERLO|nr:Trihydrophobin like protein [Verticillium longisporum]
MQFTIVAALFASVAMAAPPPSTPCCATSVLGVADLDCSVPSSTPSDGADLKRICAESGAAAMCCSIPLAGQGVLCTPVVG